MIKKKLKDLFDGFQSEVDGRDDILFRLQKEKNNAIDDMLDCIDFITYDQIIEEKTRLINKYSDRRDEIEQMFESYRKLLNICYNEESDDD